MTTMNGVATRICKNHVNKRCHPLCTAPFIRSDSLTPKTQQMSRMYGRLYLFDAHFLPMVFDNDVGRQIEELTRHRCVVLVARNCDLLNAFLRTATQKSVISRSLTKA